MLALTYPKVFGRFFASVGYNFVADFRAFIQAAQACPLNRRDVDEHVLAASVWLNKAIALGCVEPLYSTYCHVSLPWSFSNAPEW